MGNGDSEPSTAPAPGVGTARVASAAPTPQLPRFEGARAFETLTRLVEFGNRHYAAPRRPQALSMLEELLRAGTTQVSRQTFAATEKTSGETYQLTNVIARLHPERGNRVLLGSHFDTRLWAEEDADSTRRQQPIAGANDGSSGVAVLIEALRLMATDPAFANAGIDVVLFDGEEFGRPGPGGGDYCKGSIYLADHIDELYPDARPQAAIVLDMVGDRQLSIKREQSSQRPPSRGLNDLFWEVGRRHAPRVFDNRTRSTIIDDHTPLQKIGVPAILVIDLEYPHWHTHQDTLDKVSPESLAIVGTTLLEVVHRLTHDGTAKKSTP